MEEIDDFDYQRNLSAVTDFVTIAHAWYIFEERSRAMSWKAGQSKIYMNRIDIIMALQCDELSRSPNIRGILMKKVDELS